MRRKLRFFAQIRAFLRPLLEHPSEALRVWWDILTSPDRIGHRFTTFWLTIAGSRFGSSFFE